jgi:hypothetical protein
MERIFSKVKIFLLKKIVFPVLKFIAKYKRKKTLKKREASLYNEIKNWIQVITKKNQQPIKNPSIPPKQYGQYLQQTGKQIWVKKLK